MCLLEWAGEEKARSSYTNLVQPRILSFNNTLWRLEALGNWDVVQDQVGCPRLTVSVDKHFSLQDFVQTLSVYKAEVGNGSVFVCKTIGKDKKHH